MALFDSLSQTGTTSFLNGVNYGNVFIPESFFADRDFYEKNNIPQVAEQNSLCDLAGDGAQAAMEDWLNTQIKESDFQEMK